MNSARELDRLLVTLDVDVQTLAFCKIRSGRHLIAPPIDAVMMHYVLAGTMHVRIPGFEPLVCGPGCIAVIPPGLQLHVAADDGPSVGVAAEELCHIGRDGVLTCDAADGGPGDVQYVSGIVLASYSGSFGLFDKLKKPISQHLADVEIVRHAYKAMLDELARPSLGARALTGALMKACLVLVIRHSIARAETASSMLQALSDPRFGKAIEAILDRPAEPYSMEKLAALAGMSRSTFARRFGEAFGMSAMEFLAKTRLYHGAQLLRSTPIPVKVIAATIGFASRSHFSRAFKAAYGLDPRTFRERARAEPLDPPKAVHANSALAERCSGG